MRIIPFVVVFVLSGMPVLTSPALTGQTCLIRGEVVKVAAREVLRDPGWARSWGVQDKTTYTDVTIRPIKVSHLEDGFSPSCTGDIQTFQINTGTAPLIGSCVTATAMFSGDEFRIGTWLTEVEPAPCA